MAAILQPGQPVVVVPAPPNTDCWLKITWGSSSPRVGFVRCEDISLPRNTKALVPIGGDATDRLLQSAGIEQYIQIGTAANADLPSLLDHSRIDDTDAKVHEIYRQAIAQGTSYGAIRARFQPYASDERVSRLTEQFQRPLLRRINDLYSIDAPLQLLRRIVPYLSGVETIPASPQRIQAMERIERALRKPELLADLMTASARAAAAVLHTQPQVEDRLVTNLRAGHTLAGALKPVHFANLYVLSPLSDAEVAEYAAFLESEDVQWFQGIIKSELMKGAEAVGTAMATGMSRLPKPPAMPPPGVARGTDPETLYTLGVQLIDAGNETEALRFLNDSIRIRPDYAIAWYKRGNAWRNLNQTAKSIDDYTQAIRLDSSMAYAYLNRGNLYRDSGQLERALADF